MSQQLPEEWFIKDARLNAGIAWLFVALLIAAVIGNILTGLLTTAAFAAATVIVAIVLELLASPVLRLPPRSSCFSGAILIFSPFCWRSPSSS